MQITRLELNNFSSYEGMNIFDFSVDKERPIILIGGQNGAGKTSLFTAIKIALYGPLSFGYTGNNSFYSKKIKGYINDKAFQSQCFSSGVSIGIELIKDREIFNYTIKRDWTIIDSRIEENFSVFEGEKKLDESEKILFENYILNVLPIDLFEFFLFDGEEIGNIFSNESYNKFLKKALLIICGIDDFEILHNFSANYVCRKNDTDGKKIDEEYSDLNQKFSENKSRIASLMNTISEHEHDISSLNAFVEQKQAEFIRSGGIPKEESRKLEEKAAKLDKERENISREIKLFFEELLPFFIMRNSIMPLERQSRYEEKASICEYVKNMLPEKVIVDVLEEHSVGNSKVATALYNAIIKKFEVTSGVFDDTIFGFSESERGKVFHLAESVKDYNSAELVDKISRKDTLLHKAIDIRQKLRNALSEEDAQKYTDEILNAQHRIQILELEMAQKLTEVDNLKEEQEALEKDIYSLKEKIRELTQDRHVLDLTNSISAIMAEIISTSMENIRKQLSRRIIDNLMQIYRKENLISIIEISEDFRFELYQTQQFSITELQALLENLGKKEFFRILGTESIKALRRCFSITSEDDLELAILSCKDNWKIELYKRIELNMLSKGERQIFILALYWAIIQVSGKQIPFIIDTPYARIDAKHREGISSKFFPNISNQVVILSTDEEITREYYNIIKPFISKEYLLKNNQGDNKTTVTDGYFFKEDEL